MEENTGRKKSGFAAGLLTGIVIMLMISILGFGGWYIVNRNSSGSYTSENVTEGDVSKKLDKLNKLIDKYYLYQDEVDQDALVEGIYSGYAAALGDPYTVYYNKDETKALMESTSGTFSGVGATLTKDADTKAVTIVNVYQDSPADGLALLPQNSMGPLVLLRAWPSTLLLLLLCPFLFTPFRWQEFGYSQYHLRMTGLLNNRIKRNWRDDGATHCRAFLT